jgi:chemotaxis methyl-accepting protein methylase
MDLVLCRYLAFTYYRGERLLAATRRLWESIRPGGALMVGRKERLPESASALFEPWPDAAGFYRRSG